MDIMWRCNMYMLITFGSKKSDLGDKVLLLINAAMKYL